MCVCLCAGCACVRLPLTSYKMFWQCGPSKPETPLTPRKSEQIREKPQRYTHMSLCVLYFWGTSLRYYARCVRYPRDTTRYPRDTTLRYYARQRSTTQYFPQMPQRHRDTETQRHRHVARTEVLRTPKSLNQRSLNQRSLTPTDTANTQTHLSHNCEQGILAIFVLYFIILPPPHTRTNTYTQTCRASLGTLA